MWQQTTRTLGYRIGQTTLLISEQQQQRDAREIGH